jgi:predicted transcriptional regulator
MVMDTETLFTATKWEILKLLEERAHAPIEIASKLGSSLANVSQQLKLLELAGVVKTKRVSNREKGQPRVLYSLVGNLSYMIATTDNFVDKKVVHLSERNKAVLRIWFLEDPKVRYALEKAFWQIEEQLPQVQQITYVGIEEGSPVLEIASEQSLPSQIEVGGEFSTVKLRAESEPSGYVLFSR